MINPHGWLTCDRTARSIGRFKHRDDQFGHQYAAQHKRGGTNRALAEHNKLSMEK